MTSAGGRRRRVGRRRLPAAIVAVVAAIGCVPTRGGWDVEALRQAVPGLAGIEGERLGDLVPFPALAPDGAASGSERVALVICRFPVSAPIRIRTTGPGWWEEPGAKALAALAAELEPLGLALARVGREEAGDAGETGEAEIEVTAFASEGPELPEGLGDTLVECDVAERDDPTSGPADGAGVRGRIRRAEVRLRRSGHDAAGRLRIASDEAWVGALLHELGHALGFAGHAATGRSILVRDEHRLRERGRAVLRGEPLVDPTLEALHRLEPGRRLGVRRLNEVGGDWVRAIRALDRKQVAAGRRRIAVIASVGDREARWSLCYSDGSRLSLRFPGWAERLRGGREIVAVPDRPTLAAIAAWTRSGGSRDAVSR